MFLYETFLLIIMKNPEGFFCSKANRYIHRTKNLAYTRTSLCTASSCLVPPGPNVKLFFVATEGSWVTGDDTHGDVSFLLQVTQVVSDSKGPKGSVLAVVSEQLRLAIHSLTSLRSWAVWIGDREPFELKAWAWVYWVKDPSLEVLGFNSPLWGWMGSVHWYAADCTIFLVQTHHFLHLIICFKDQKSESVVFAPDTERKTWGPPKSLQDCRGLCEAGGSWCLALITKGDFYCSIHLEMDCLTYRCCALHKMSSARSCLSGPDLSKCVKRLNASSQG